MIDEDREDRERQQREREKARRAQFRNDVQEVMGSLALRRVLHEFLLDSGVDGSPLQGDPQYTAHAIGWANAGRWWLNAIRTHCPEREQQMRAEARKQSKESDDE